MSFDFAKAVIDDEIVAMLRRIQRGLEISEENFALDIIKEVGPGGMFADHLHTLERMRSTGLLPEIADRDPRQGWIEKGGLDAQGRAMLRVRDILTRDAPSLFSPEVDARLRSEFAGMVVAEFAPPEGWTRAADETLSDRAERRRRRLAQQA
jgi:trimethylamine--corrinoid protein Co-methyltransferase